ncbi:MAG: hypothetical protein HQM04_09025 [Magnetococcales bacterium]|nr:hypothetical protein [Magnetococcales bacterium]MBF0115176.1 hypothetical protein [Magnetococcales bacterium]
MCNIPDGLTDINRKLAEFCVQLSTNCLYNAATLFVWVRILQVVKVFFVVTPLVLGSLSAWAFLEKGGFELVVAISAFLAGLLPSIYSSLKIDVNIDKSKSALAEYKNLRDQFVLCAQVKSLLDPSSFDEYFQKNFERLEIVRKTGLAPPEWCYFLAARKIKNGDYS